MTLLFLKEQYRLFVNAYPDKQPTQVDSLFLQWAKNLSDQLHLTINQASAVYTASVSSETTLITHPTLSAQLTLIESLDDLFQAHAVHQMLSTAFVTMEQIIDKHIPWRFQEAFDITSAATLNHDHESALSLRLRNRSLVSSLNKHRNQTTFLIAGRGHFKSSITNCDYLFEMDKAACELSQTLADEQDPNRFALMKSY